MLDYDNDEDADSAWNKMNEEQLRAQFEEWYEADAMPGESDWFKMKDDEYHHLNTQNAWEGFQACAKIKDAEIEALTTRIYKQGRNYLELQAQVEKMREYLKYANTWMPYDLPESKVINALIIATPESSLAEHDKEVEIKVLQKSIYCTVDQIRAMIEERRK